MGTKIRLLIYIGLFSALLTSCVSSIDNERRASFYLQIGNDYLEQKNYPEALTNLIEANKLSPNNPYILNSLGLLYLAREKYSLAAEHIQKALSINPKYTDARNNLGRVYISQGKYKSAISEIKTTLKDLTYSSPERAQTNLGLAYMRTNQYPKAKEQLLSALKTNQDYCPAYGYYGQTLMKLKQFEDASAVLDRGIRVCQYNPEEVHYLSGLSYYQSGRKEMAITRFKEVSKLYPASEYAEKSRSLLKVIEQDK